MKILKFDRGPDCTYFGVCTECNKPRLKLVRLGEIFDCESQTVQVCKSCIIKANKLLAQK
jgi:hypothetical protein